MSNSSSENSPTDQNQLKAKRDWVGLREWLNVSAALGALLVGLVSIWITTRISGLEDYFRSEVARRNSELDSLTKQTETLRNISESRSERLLDLQASADTLTSESIKAQRHLLESQDELDKVRGQVTFAQLSLDRTLRAQTDAENKLESQNALFDLFKRRQTYEIATILFSFQSAYDDGDQDGFTGEDAFKALKTFRPSQGDEQLIPYFEIMKANFLAVCPNFLSMRPTLPAISPEPKAPTITYRKGASKAEIDALTVKAQNEWTVNWNKWVETSEANFKAKGEWNKKILDVGESCICRSLVDQNHSQSAICPTVGSAPSANAS